MWLLEQPLIILFVGALAFAPAAAIWLQTRQRGAFWVVVAILAVTTGGLVLEWLVVTDAEQVEATVHRIARLLEQNDAPAVIESISETAPALRREASEVLAQIVVSSISVKRNLKVQVVERAGRTSAEARFNAVATVTDRKGLTGTQVLPRFLVVRFLREGDNWKAISYEVFDPRDGMRETPRPVSGR